jgi:O-antigen/teichoic acid export membrane protein
VAADQQRVDMSLNVIMSVVNILLNFFLIPRYGPLGASLATFISICLYATIQYGYIRHYMPSHAAPWPERWRPLSATGIMGVCIWWFQQIPLPVIMILAFVVYTSVLLVSRFFTHEELHILHLDKVMTKLGFSKPLS